MPPTQKRRLVAVVAFFLVLMSVIVGLMASASGGLLFVLAIAPSSFLLWHFYNADKYKRESKRLLGGTFLIGAVSVIPAYFIEIAFKEPSLDAGFLAVFAYFVLAVGFVEELMKLLSVRIYAYRSKQFDEPMDGIVFGVTAALGFATIENILAVLSTGIWTAVYRAMVSVPAHAFYGAIVGFYLGEAKIRGRPLLALKGLIFAALLHGLFDTFATVTPTPMTALVTLPALVWIVYFKVVRKEIAEAEAESPYRSQPHSATQLSRPGSTQRPPKFCTQCGASIQEGWRYCTNCGRPLT